MIQLKKKILLKNKVLILVAVRLKSARLPKKAIEDLYGEPLVIRLTERVRKAEMPDDLIWCTSTNSQDDPLEELALKHGISCFRGSELDVMSRFIQIADQENASIVVRVTGDNPLTDPFMMDSMIESHLKKGAEYTFTEDLPLGTRSEIIDVKMLRRCHKLLQDPNASEYMTWMLNRPEHFKTLHVPVHSQKIRRPEISLTVDTEDDLSLLQRIYENFQGKPPALQHIISWLDNNPQLLRKNSNSPKPHFTKTVNCKLVSD
jgi:spore coat polysaccharide biosynthesis protein SpsF (cytidylyltransferase family)